MADKPRVKAPRQRHAPAAGADRTRRLVIIAGGLAALLVAGVVALAVVGFSGGGSSSLAGKLAAARCTLKSYPGVSRQHITDASARPRTWNSFPPTSGPHYYIPAVYGFYTSPLQLARILHNLEHGGVYMLYGSKTPADTADKLREIYDQDPRGLVVAPLPELGDKIALGAWTSKNPGSGEVGTGHLAKCTQVDKKAFDAFITAFRGRGPEGERLDQLQPGGI
jgi:hypothetical protein